MYAFLGWDPLARTFISGPHISVDTWSFVHVVTFFGCGYFCPGRKFEFLLFGIAWEYFEFLLSTEKEFWSERSANSLCDVWFNLFGYWLGEMLDEMITDRMVIRILVGSFLGTWFGLLILRFA